MNRGNAQVDVWKLLFSLAISCSFLSPVPLMEKYVELSQEMDSLLRRKDLKNDQVRFFPLFN